jgi:hypothetical protein
MIVSRLSSIPPVQLSLGYPITLDVHHPSRSLHFSCPLVLRLLRIRLVSSCLVNPPPSPPRYIENLSSNHLTYKWMEGMFGSGIPPSTLSIPSPTARSFCCGTSWTCRHLFIKVGSFGLLVVASLFPCPSLLSKLGFKFSSAYMLLFAYSYYL